MLKRDLLLIVGLLLTALLVFVFLRFFVDKGALVQITIAGKSFATVRLDQDAVIPIGRTNTLVIKDGYAFMESADCNDQICVHHRKISRTDESIICLPNKVVVTIVNAKERDVDAFAQ
ncbi:MAG: hypothetical protein BGN88_14900 [Clostridiales bacterium 43-6]|nr:MAG: hypothetical protein BGN88_14900 [Clostridiales bacterium 43-6]